MPPPCVARRSMGRRVLDTLLDLLYPPRCVACGAWGAWLCDDCLASVPQEAPTWRPGRARGVLPTCCSAIGWVAAHRQPLRPAVHALKYAGVTALVEPLAGLLAARWQRDPFPATLVAPVPLHAARERLRGYNQAALLAEGLAERLALPCRPRLLARVRETSSQVGLDPRQRLQNVWGAFQAAEPLAGERVLLIDDVMTTGATLQAAALAIRAAGAAEVWALTLTRAPGRLRWPPAGLRPSGGPPSPPIP